MTKPLIAIRNIAIATVLGIVPYLFEFARFFPSETVFFVAFGVLGLVAGVSSSYWGILGAPISFGLAILIAQTTHFVGGNGDGNLWYVFAVVSSTCYLGTIVLGAMAGSVYRYLTRNPATTAID